MSLRIEPLAPPRPGALTLYVGGRGYGESQVLVLPQGQVIVVDTCLSLEHHIPLDLFDAFGLERVDLLVVTHADLDHCSGVPALLDRLMPRRIWRFPAYSMSELLARTLTQAPQPSRRLQTLRDVLARLDDAVEAHIAHEADLNTARYVCGEVSVQCLAPCATDTIHAAKELSSLIAWRGDVVELSQRVSAYLGGAGSRPGGAHNMLSLALSVRWGDVLIVLGGDVEGHHANRGWAGILRELERDDRLSLIDAPAVVKVAHHGSRASLSEEVWARHTCGGTHRPIALLTPYQRGELSSRPPQLTSLGRLRELTTLLGATASPKPARWPRFSNAGWLPVDAPPQHSAPALSHWLGVVFAPDEPPVIQVAPGATLWRASPR